jgi:hypothetical protein
MNSEEIAAIRERIKTGGNEYALTRMAYDLTVALDALEEARGGNRDGFITLTDEQARILGDSGLVRGPGWEARLRLRARRPNGEGGE